MLIFNPETAPYYPTYLRELASVSAERIVGLAAAPVHDEAGLEATITALASEGSGGLITAADPFTVVHRALIMRLVDLHRVPAIYQFRRFVAEGGLMSYGPDTMDIFRRSASYVDRILKGALPTDLPAQAPTKYELVINLNTAKALGLAVPPSLLARADEVIE
jgi:putative ABC transport system substrate-binding protein